MVDVIFHLHPPARGMPKTKEVPSQSPHSLHDGIMTENRGWTWFLTRSLRRHFVRRAPTTCTGAEPRPSDGPLEGCQRRHDAAVAVVCRHDTAVSAPHVNELVHGFSAQMRRVPTAEWPERRRVCVPALVPSTGRRVRH